jgi:hypothetical protein
MHAFDIETYEWNKLEIEGTAPFPRGGHSAALLEEEGKILIYGGWSNTS